VQVSAIATTTIATGLLDCLHDNGTGPDRSSFYF